MKTTLGDDVGYAGAVAFGLVIGWLTYSITRNRSDGVSIGDIAVVIGAVGGAAVLALFPSGTSLFACYSFGLAVGFFGYFAVLLHLVTRNRSAGWTTELFLDGRRPPLAPGADRAATPAMGDRADNRTVGQQEGNDVTRVPE